MRGRARGAAGAGGWGGLGGLRHPAGCPRGWGHGHLPSEGGAGGSPPRSGAAVLGGAGVLRVMEPTVMGTALCPPPGQRAPPVSLLPAPKLLGAGTALPGGSLGSPCVSRAGGPHTSPGVRGQLGSSLRPPTCPGSMGSEASRALEAGGVPWLRATRCLLSTQGRSSTTRTRLRAASPRLALGEGSLRPQEGQGGAARGWGCASTRCRQLLPPPGEPQTEPAGTGSRCAPMGDGLLAGSPRAKLKQCPHKEPPP